MNSEFIKKYSEAFIISGLFIIFYLLFFHNMGAYPLMDIDETRYVSMSRDMFHSKDFMTLYLNGDFFFEKPPLYFWLESISFWFFGAINEFSARFSVALCAMLSSFLMYFTGKKIISRNFGVISALILATSFEFLVLSKIAILDMLLTTCIGLSLYSGFMTFFVKAENKKYFWWLFYIFSSLGVLAKGLPAFVVPFGTMFFTGIISKKLKEYFKPQYFLVGFTLFFAISLPWHLAMFQMHDPLFFNEYIMKHHISRFLSSKAFGRVQPWYYFIIMFSWGFIPWIGSFTAMLCSKISQFKVSSLGDFKFQNLTNPQKFMLLNSIAFIFILLFFSSSSMKLMTYILSIYFPASFLTASFWKGYMKNLQHKKSLSLSVFITNFIFIVIGITAFFSKLFLPTELYSNIAPVNFSIGALFLIIGIAGIYFASKDKAKSLFASYVVLIVIFSSAFCSMAFNIDYKFGQNDLIKYATYSKENAKELASYQFGRRYSLLYYYGKKMHFEIYSNPTWFNDFIERPNTVVVIPNKCVEIIRKEHLFETINKGRKYSLIKNKK